MFPPVRNPSTQSAAPKFGEKDLIRRSASTVTPPAQRQTEVAKLIDVSKCIGCKACQTACLEWNQLHEDIGVNVGVYDNPHDLTPASWTLMRYTEYENPASGNLVLQGLLGVAGADLTYPAIGVTASGRGVIAFTYTDASVYPSAAYAPLDAKVGAGAWSFAGHGGQGAAVDDGFTSYKSQVGNPPRTRWGDYGAAAVDGNSIWIASEYVAHACDYAAWGGQFFGGTGDNKLGTCATSPGAAGKRTALGNWSTRITRFTP